MEGADHELDLSWCQPCKLKQMDDFTMRVAAASRAGSGPKDMMPQLWWRNGQETVPKEGSAREARRCSKSLLPIYGPLAGTGDADAKMHTNAC